MPEVKQSHADQSRGGGRKVLYIDMGGRYWDETSGKRLDEEDVVKVRM